MEIFKTIINWETAGVVFLISALFGLVIYKLSFYVFNHKFKYKSEPRTEPNTKYCNDCGADVMIFDKDDDCCIVCKTMWMKNSKVNDPK